MCLVTTLIGFFSLTAHASPWGKTTKWISGTQASSKAHGLMMWCHSFLHEPKRKSDRSLQPSWIRDINYRTGFTTEHLLKFTTLWALVTQTPLTPHHEDKTSWTFTKHGDYTTTSTYKA
jgi:hypothetical protein